jgi:serine O-acetyltransferase
MSYLRSDLKRYFRNKRGLARIKMVLLTQGIWATIVFRMGSWCHRRKGKFVWPILILPFLTVLQKMVEIGTGISIPFTANIGRGLYIGHFGGIVLSPDTVLGEYCNLSQGVTIGQAGRGGRQLTPVIGDRAYIGPGAKIFGGIRIGNDVAIGANAVVTKDLPDKAVAVGVPAQIVNFDGSKDFVIIPEET